MGCHGFKKRSDHWSRRRSIAIQIFKDSDGDLAAGWGIRCYACIYLALCDELRAQERDRSRGGPSARLSWVELEILTWRFVLPFH
jgi:hypothetical protein